MAKGIADALMDKKMAAEPAEQEFDPLETAASELIEAVQSGDAAAVAAALRSAFDLLGRGGMAGPMMGEE